MSGLFSRLVQAGTHVLAEMAGQAVGLLALVAGLFAWAYTSSAFVGVGVVVAGLLVAGWVSTLADKKKDRKGPENGSGS